MQQFHIIMKKNQQISKNYREGTVIAIILLTVFFIIYLTPLLTFNLLYKKLYSFSIKENKNIKKLIYRDFIIISELLFILSKASNMNIPHFIHHGNVLDFSSQEHILVSQQRGGGTIQCICIGCM